MGMFSGHAFEVLFLGLGNVSLALAASASVAIETEGIDLDEASLIRAGGSAMEVSALPGVDLAFAYNGSRASPIVPVLHPGMPYGVRSAPFGDVNGAMAARVGVRCNFADVSLGLLDTLFLRTDRGSWFKVDRVQMEAGADRVRFEYARIASPLAVEPKCAQRYPDTSSTGARTAIRHEDATLLPHDTIPTHRFGRAIGIDTRRVLASATGGFAGGVYDFKRRGHRWVEAAKLAPLGGLFAWELLLDGETALISAEYGTGNVDRSGLVYRYRNRGFSNWRNVGWIEAQDAQTLDLFGTSIARDGEWLAVGALASEQTGAAYVFEHVSGSTDEWIERAKLTPPDGETYDQFGLSVAISDDTVVVGAPRHNNDAGAAYVYERSGTEWRHTGKLADSEPRLGDGFGGVVAVEGRTIMVGVGRRDDGATNSGVVYVFERGEDGVWEEETQLRAVDPGTTGFGGEVLLRGGIAMVGAGLSDDWRGSAYVFERQNDDWHVVEILEASDRAELDFFGGPIAFDGHTAAISAVGKNIFAGAVYIFEFEPALTVPLPTTARDLPTLDSPTAPTGKPR